MRAIVIEKASLYTGDQQTGAIADYPLVQIDRSKELGLLGTIRTVHPEGMVAQHVVHGHVQLVDDVFKIIELEITAADDEVNILEA